MGQLSKHQNNLKQVVVENKYEEGRVGGNLAGGGKGKTSREKRAEQESVR